MALIEAPGIATGVLPPEPEPEPYAARRTVALTTGTLHLSVAQAEWPLEQLCGFAARRNPKRGFLFVSKVLGRHIPVRPATMRAVQRSLAGQIPADLPGPVVVVGMAETAVALGQGVHAAYQERTGRADVLFIHTTRYRLQRELALTFLEEHSHAARHLLYWPEAEADQALFRAARSLVLVDDEASTGMTFINLARALAPVMPAARNLVCAVITDWRGTADGESGTSAAGLPMEAMTVSLLRGGYRFEPRSGAPPVDMPDVTGNGGSKDALIRGNYGRFGLRAPPVLPESLVEQAAAAAAGRRVLVLGSGEFVYPPFLLAERLEAAGAEVFCQATTRSPIMPGHDIGAILSFKDNYGDGIVNFVYNLDPGAYDRVLLCQETPAGHAPQDLLASTQAHVVVF